MSMGSGERTEVVYVEGESTDFILDVSSLLGEYFSLVGVRFASVEDRLRHDKTPLVIFDVEGCLRAGVSDNDILSLVTRLARQGQKVVMYGDFGYSSATASMEAGACGFLERSLLRRAPASLARDIQRILALPPRGAWPESS
jgi:hypothetical protein